MMHSHNGQKVHRSRVDKRPMDVLSIPADCLPMKQVVAAAILSPEMHPDRVGERITAWREVRRLSKAELADSVNLDRSSLSKIEAGKKGLDIAVGSLIAAMYGVGLDYIYRGDLNDLPDDIRAAVAAKIYILRAAKHEDQAALRRS